MSLAPTFIPILLVAGTVRVQMAAVVHPVWIAEGGQTAAMSPDGRWRLTVPKSHSSAFPWLTLEAPDSEYEEQKWPLQRRGCYVLWRPDSKVFALTDPEYANHYFIRVFSTQFELEGSTPGSPVIDLNLPLERAFRDLATRQYGSKEYDIDLFFVKALRWLEGNNLLVGLDARTSPASAHAGPALDVRDWYLGYVMDPERRQIIRQLDAAAVLREFGIDLEKESW